MSIGKGQSMRYKLELPIRKPRAEVWMAFANPENTGKWQITLVESELVDGMIGQPGAVTKLTFKTGEREYSLTEKITHRSEPESMESVYDNEFAKNTVRNIFLEQGGEETLWRMEVEFKFKTLLMRILSTFVKKNFVANTQRDMERFKELIENL
jgi:hypothetical protein